MAKRTIVSSIDSASFNYDSTDFFIGLQGERIESSSVEADVEQAVRVAGTFSNLGVNVYLQQVIGDIVFRKNRAAAAGLSITIDAGTGIYEDLTGSHAVGPTDECNWRWEYTSGSITNRVSVIWADFEAVVDTAKIIGGSAGPFLPDMNQNSTTVFLSAVGGLTGESTAEGTDVKWPVPGNGKHTWTGLWVNVFSNTRSTDCTFEARVNGASGNQSVVIDASTSGVFEDLTGADTVQPADTINTGMVMGSGGGNLLLRGMSGVLVNTADTMLWPVQLIGGQSLNNGLIRYQSMDAIWEDGWVTESQVQQTIREPVTFENISAHVTQNALTSGGADITLYKNGVSQAATLHWDFGETGIETDLTNTVAYAAGDEVSLQWKSDSSGAQWTPTWFSAAEPGIQNEISYDPAEITSGETIGLHWIELYHKDAADADKVYLWAGVDLNDPLTYYGGYKEPRILRFGAFERALSDYRGQYESASFSWTVADHDKLIRTTFLDGTGIEIRTMLNRDVAMRTVDDVSRRTQERPRLVARGKLRDISLDPPLKATFIAEDALSARFNVIGRSTDIPNRTITDAWNTDDQNVLGSRVPILYGALTDSGASTAAAPTGLTAVGQLQATSAPTGLAAVIQAGGFGRIHDLYYHITAVISGQETQLSATIKVKGEDLSPTNKRVHLTWDSVSGASSIIVYRSHRSDYAQYVLTKLSGGATSFNDDWTGDSQRANPNFQASPFELGLRMNIQYAVFSRQSDGTYSQPAIVRISANGVSDAVSKGSYFFAGGDPLGNNSLTRTVKVDWSAAAGATGYKVMRWISYYSDWQARFDFEIDLPPSILTYTDTFPFARRAHATAVETPGGQEEVKGSVPARFIDVETIAGKEWNRLLICGHASKAIQQIFYSVADAGGVTALDPEATSPRTFLEATNFGAAGEWLAPGQTGWPFGNDFIEVGGERFTVIYTSLDPVPQFVAVNLLAAEDVGDGTGTLIDNGLDIMEHFLTNYWFNDYKTGNYFPAPTWDADLDGDGVPLIDTASLDRVKTVQQRRLPGGYPAAGGFGMEGESVDIREALARIAISGGFDYGFSRNSQVLFDILDDDITNVPTSPIFDGTGDNNLIVKNSLKVKLRKSELENEIVYNYSRIPFDQTWFKRQQSITDVESIAAHQQTYTGKELDLWFVNSSAVALNLAQYRLLAHKETPRYISLRTSINALDDELGDTRRITHPELPSDLTPGRLVRHRAEMGGQAVALEFFDMTRIYQGSALLCDNTVATGSYASATPLERAKCFYLCDETTGTFVNGDPGKRLR